MQRAAVLWRASPGRLVAALFALMLAAAMAVGTGANFNSTSSNVGNVVTAGIIDHDNNGPSLNIDKLMPGTPKSGTIQLQNTGDDAAGSSLVASGLVDTPGPGGGDLSPELDLEIRDTVTNTVVFDDKLDQLATVDLSTWDAGDTRDYQFTVELPDTGLNGADNEFMESSVSLDARLGAHLLAPLAHPRIMRPMPSRARRAAVLAAGGLGRMVLGLACLVLIATLVPGLFGYQRFVVVGGSMEPTIHRGSLVFDEVVPVGSLATGDVITYVPPGHSDPVTHRIIERDSRPRRTGVPHEGRRQRGAGPAPVHARPPDAGAGGLRRPIRGLPVHVPRPPSRRGFFMLVLPAIALGAVHARAALARRRPHAGAVVRRALVALAVLAAFTVPASRANFNDRSANSAAISTDSVGNYLRLWSQGTDPAGLTGYATKRGSEPAVPGRHGRRLPGWRSRWAATRTTTGRRWPGC